LRLPLRRRNRLAAAVAVAIVPMFTTARVRAGVVVEQIEAYEDATNPKTHYAPTEFGGSSTVAGPNDTANNINFTGITFHAIDGTTNTKSSHAEAVGEFIYGRASDNSFISPGNGFVTNVYAAAADPFLSNTMDGQPAVSSIGPIPGHFATGARVVNNSWVARGTSNLDDRRRVDFMINRDDVTFVAAATDTGALAGNYLVWSSFNSVAVRGDQDGFDPTNSPGKSHADFVVTGQASFAAATVAGYAAGLYGNAPTAAQHGVVMRSLLMAGADKPNYSRDTTNNLSIQSGAGVPDYNTSLAILSAGQQSLSLASGSGNGSTVAATETFNSKGWSYATITNNTVDALVFHVTNPVDSITASLNWKVTSNSTATTIDTTDAGQIFPHLLLDLKPVTFTSGHYVIGSTFDPTFHSSSTNDNVEYIYSTNTLAPGDYAFLITGDPSLLTSVGFSFSLVGPPVSQWNASTGGSWASAGNWSGGVPNSHTARADFLAGPGITAPATVALDGNQTVGQITFANSRGYTIARGTGGKLTFDDTGDGVSGSGGPLITVNTGSHFISAPISLVNGLTINTAASTSLSLTGAINGSGALTKSGAGLLTLDGGANTYSGDTVVSGGTLTLGAGSSLVSSQISVFAGTIANLNGSLESSATVNAGGTTNFGGNIGTGPHAQMLAALNVGFGVTVSIELSQHDFFPATLQPTSLVFDDSEGKLDLTDNILVSPGTAGNAEDLIDRGVAHPGHFITSAAGLMLGYKDSGGGNYEVRATLLGDANLDGTVNAADLADLAGNYGKSSGQMWANGDFDSNGNVNVADLADLTSNFGATLSGEGTAAGSAPATATAVAVPEPVFCAVPLLSLVFGLLSERRRRRRTRPEFVAVGCSYNHLIFD
jgi:autotransporter-associated beta strand protein